ncbi:MAG: hypothetical protein KGK11_06540 [Sphingomonadales bacterium]|nr:hypothetical protein [Sphingomonadales bacterium]
MIAPIERAAFFHFLFSPEKYFHGSFLALARLAKPDGAARRCAATMAVSAGRLVTREFTLLRRIRDEALSLVAGGSGGRKT